MENQNNDKRTKFKKVFWKLFGFGILCLVLLFAFISFGWIGYLPPLEELQNPQNKFASEIYSSDMQLLGRFFKNKENRVEVHFNDISKNVINALIATEDKRFYEHSGIDGKALARAVLLTGICSKKAPGAEVLSRNS